MRARVQRARERQRTRYAHTAGASASDSGHTAVSGHTNAAAPSRLVAPASRMEPAARALLVRAADKLSHSARSYHRVLRVARTIADLDDADSVGTQHIGEALRFRPVEWVDHDESGGRTVPAQ